MDWSGCRRTLKAVDDLTSGNTLTHSFLKNSLGAIKPGPSGVGVWLESEDRGHDEGYSAPTGAFDSLLMSDVNLVVAELREECRDVFFIVGLVVVRTACSMVWRSRTVSN